MPVDGGPETPLPTDWGTYAQLLAGRQAIRVQPPPGRLVAQALSRQLLRPISGSAISTPRRSSKMLDADLPDEEKPNNFWPMFGSDAIYFVSDRAVRGQSRQPGSPQEREQHLEAAARRPPPMQVTQHTSGSLFWPSISSDGRTIVYEENFGSVEARREQRHKPVEVKIDIVADERENNFETRTITSEADAYHLSPSGKRAVISVEGELFTIATDRGEVHRLTHSSGARDGTCRSGRPTASGSRSSAIRAAARRFGCATNAAAA